VVNRKDDNLEILGARVHNLKNIDITIPRDKLVVITGLSGSGKSSLAFDTIYAEGQRRYMETFSAYARQFIGNINQIKQISGIFDNITRLQGYIQKLPKYSFAIWFKFKLEAPYFSKDDDEFYIIQNPILKEPLADS